MNKTKIEWCDSTWNPVTGCLHGCTYCYARRIAERFGSILKEDSEEYRSKKLHVVEEKKHCSYPFVFEPTLHRYRIDEPKRKTKSQNIFVCSMADLFGDWVHEDWIKEVFQACEAAPQHNYLFLTKNPKMYDRLYDNDKLPYADNIWYGYSVTDNKTSKIFLSPEHKTFMSIEPLHEKLDAPMLAAIAFTDWVIIGAETGQNKNKTIPEKQWINNIVNECKKNNVPVFMKDSLIPIVGEENMLREFPDQLKKGK